MRKKIKISNPHNHRDTEIEVPEICPICKKQISPVLLYSVIYQDNHDEKWLSILAQCTGCYKSFVCQYSDYCDYDGEPEFQKLVYCEPNRFTPRNFSDLPENISNDFKRVYNQACAAEEMELDEIAGMGYRKSLEFLIKDFLIDEEPDDVETIKKMALGNCIAHKITDERLKTVASRCAWIGNDESHYYRKHSDLGIDDLKMFLEAVIFWISTSYVTKKALNIEKKE